MKLCTFDTSGKTGYAGGDQAAARPEFSGTFKLPVNKPLTTRMVALETFAIDIIKKHGVQAIWVEQPFVMNTKSEDALYTMMGLVFAVGMAAEKCGVFCKLVGSQEWRSDLGLPTVGPKDVMRIEHYRLKFGARKGGGVKEAKRQWVKDQAMEYARRRMGVEPEDDNEGDAICMWRAFANERQAAVLAPTFDFGKDVTI